MYRRLLSIVALSLTVSACVPYYGGYRSEVYVAPTPYYGGGYRPYYVYPRTYYMPSPHAFQGAGYGHYYSPGYGYGAGRRWGP